MTKNIQSNLIASVKMLNVGVIYKDIMNLGVGRGGYLVLVNYQPNISLKFLFISPLPIIFLRKL